MRALLLLGILCAALVLPALAKNNPKEPSTTPHLIDYFHALHHKNEEVRKSFFEGMTPEEKAEWMKSYEQQQGQVDKPC